jgi:hypothetical protein
MLPPDHPAVKIEREIPRSILDVVAAVNSRQPWNALALATMAEMLRNEPAPTREAV